ncbi:hypothetical protein [Caedibacter taeniospiralis]|uniref:hypothetical protein n=1 Tax=Caedibacter taeniospiralis TaxID=28907 RepID=UPI0037BEFEE3
MEHYICRVTTAESSALSIATVGEPVQITSITYPTSTEATITPIYDSEDGRLMCETAAGEFSSLSDGQSCEISFAIQETEGGAQVSFPDTDTLQVNFTNDTSSSIDIPIQTEFTNTISKPATPGFPQQMEDKEFSVTFAPGQTSTILVSAPIDQDLNGVLLSLPPFLSNNIEDYDINNFTRRKIQRGKTHAFTFTLKTTNRGFTPFTQNEILQLQTNLTTPTDVSSAPVITVNTTQTTISIDPGHDKTLTQETQMRLLFMDL